MGTQETLHPEIIQSQTQLAGPISLMEAQHVQASSTPLSEPLEIEQNSEGFQLESDFQGRAYILEQTVEIF